MSPSNGLVSLSMVAGNVARLSKVGDFHHLGSAEIDAENQTLINHKCVCGALNRHFYQTRVIWSAFLSSVCFILLQSSRCLIF